MPLKPYHSHPRGGTIRHSRGVLTCGRQRFACWGVAAVAKESHDEVLDRFHRHGVMQAGRLEKGKLVVMPAFGAGMSWGHTIFRW